MAVTAQIDKIIATRNADNENKLDYVILAHDITNDSPLQGIIAGATDPPTEAEVVSALDDADLV